jgi:hypothetical protein
MREHGTHTSNDECRPYAVRDCLMNRTVLLYQCFRWKYHCRCGETMNRVAAMPKQGYCNHRYLREDIPRRGKRA